MANFTWGAGTRGGAPTFFEGACALPHFPFGDAIAKTVKAQKIEYSTITTQCLVSYWYYPVKDST